MQETRFHSGDHDDMLTKRFDLFSAFYDGCSRGVSWLVNCSLEAVCTLVFADLEGRLCIVDATIKDQAFHWGLCAQ